MLLHLAEIRQALVLIHAALADIEWYARCRINCIAEDQTLAFRVAFNDARIRTSHAARFIADGRSTVNLSKAHILISKRRSPRSYAALWPQTNSPGNITMTVSYTWRPFLDDTAGGGRDRYLHLQGGEVTLIFTTGEIFISVTALQTASVWTGAMLVLLLRSAGRRASGPRRKCRIFTGEQGDSGTRRSAAELRPSLVQRSTAGFEPATSRLIGEVSRIYATGKVNLILQRRSMLCLCLKQKYGEADLRAEPSATSAEESSGRI